MDIQNYKFQKQIERYYENGGEKSVSVQKGFHSEIEICKTKGLFFAIKLSIHTIQNKLFLIAIINAANESFQILIAS